MSYDIKAQKTGTSLEQGAALSTIVFEDEDVVEAEPERPREDDPNEANES